MGYTHYWTIKSNSLNQEKWNKAVEDLKKCLKRTNVSLKGWDGNGEPILNENEISFNGDCSMDEDFESFVINRVIEEDDSWNFCKTGRRPYDIAVCLALLCLKNAFGKDTFSFTSDGNLPNDGTYVEDEWIKAFEIYDKVIGHRKPRKFVTYSQYRYNENQSNA